MVGIAEEDCVNQIMEDNIKEWTVIIIIAVRASQTTEVDRLQPGTVDASVGIYQRSLGAAGIR